MKLLWLNAGLLLPLDKGGKLRTWHLMRHLARRHEISYVSFRDVSDTEDDVTGMREVASTVVTIPRTEPRKGTAQFYVDAGRFLADRTPYAVAKYRSIEYRRAVERLLGEHQFDAIVCDFLVPVVNLPDTRRCPAILFTHNVEAEIWRRHSETARNRIAQLLLAQQWRRMLRFERAALGRFDLVLAVSEADGQTFERLYPGALHAPVHIVQTGVDTSFFTPMAAATKRAHLVFTGSMDWLPNVDGMQYFVRDVLPRIRKAEPDATLSIIGRSPTPAVKRLALDAGIEITGRVDDVRPHIAEGAVYIVPLRIGGGTRLKIFEAMAMGKAVVSTTIGAEGLPVTPGEHVVIADDPAQFARAVVDLIRDHEYRRRIEIEARRLVVERYDWSSVSRDFEDALTRVCRTGVAAA
jgi:sugar transferase (PEP-CTERM/EpsH1 system associated)